MPSPSVNQTLSQKFCIRATWPIRPELIPFFRSPVLAPLSVTQRSALGESGALRDRERGHNWTSFFVAWTDWEYFYFPLDRMLVHRKATFRIKAARTHLYTWEERGIVRLKFLPKKTTQCPRKGLETGPLDPESSALTMRPPRLQTKKPSHKPITSIQDNWGLIENKSF